MHYNLDIREEKIKFYRTYIRVLDLYSLISNIVIINQLISINQ